MKMPVMDGYETAAYHTVKDLPDVIGKPATEASQELSAADLETNPELLDII